MTWGRRGAERIAQAKWLVLLLLPASFGCRTGTLPDPNDPRDVGLLSPAEVRRNLKATSDFLNYRVLIRDIGEKDRERLIARRAEELLKETDLKDIRERDAWEYGEILITAGQWAKAKKVLEIALRHPVNEDRRVNDTLRLARCEANMGEVSQAIAHARSTFSASKLDAAPILPAVLLEIVPAGLGKGHDVELGELLLDSIPQHERVYVDPTLGPGKAFLAAKPHHIAHAYADAVRIFARSQRFDLADKAQKLFDQWTQKNSQV